MNGDEEILRLQATTCTVRVYASHNHDDDYEDDVCERKKKEKMKTSVRRIE